MFLWERNLFGRKVPLNATNVIILLWTVNVLCTSISRCMRVVIIRKHNFLFCASQHVQLTSPLLIIMV